MSTVQFLNCLFFKFNITSFLYTYLASQLINYVCTFIYKASERSPDPIVYLLRTMYIMYVYLKAMFCSNFYASG